MTLLYILLVSTVLLSIECDYLQYKFNTKL